MTNNESTHLSLFTGIGGLDIAAEWTGFRTVGQCEFADYPTRILEKHWPDVPRWRDIHGLSADEFIRRTGIRQGELTCISGGFPCQPHSVAGSRKASCDERDLWPEYRRIVSEIRPKWVVVENVRGLLSSESGGFFRGILRDFSDLGYDVGWCCYRAADVGAIHARERIAIIAHVVSERCNGRSSNWEERHFQNDKEWENEKIQSTRNEWKPGIDKNLETLTNSNGKSGERIFSRKCEEETERNKTPGFWSHDRKWIKQREGIITVLPMGGTKLIKPLICRSDDGFSGAMDRNKCLGNAVVPQQFYPVFRAIADIEMSYL